MSPRPSSFTSSPADLRRRGPLRFVLALLLATVPLGCPGRHEGSKTPTASASAAPPIPGLSKTGLGFRLSDEEGSDAPPRANSAPATPLDAEETAKLFARLPPQKSDSSDVQAFAMHAKSIPAPRPGETISEAFPPPSAPPGGTPTPHVGPLHVVRHAPDGNVALAPYLTVTFDAPMVPVTSHGDLDALPVPVRLTPQPPGKWRWIGTQTAMFQPDSRFPMSTDYTVDIDAGTKSATGAVLADAQHYKFATPAPTLAEHGPNTDTAPLDPLMYAHFDQAIDPDVVLATTVVTQNGKPVKVRLATKDEMDADAEFVRVSTQRSDRGSVWLGVGDMPPSAGGTAGGQYGGATAKGRDLALKPIVPFEAASTIVVKITAGTSGLEGPRKTTNDQSFSFRTHGPLKPVRQECYGCGPFVPLAIVYSNPLDLKVFDKAWVKVSPAIPDMRVTLAGTYLTIEGRKKGRSRYVVTVAKLFTDIFAQTLEQDDVHSFDIGAADASLFPETQPMIVLDPGATKAELPVYSVNEPSLHLRLYSVTPDDYAAYRTWRNNWDWEGKPATPPGKQVVDTMITPRQDADELVETRVDLAPALTGKVGQVLAVVESMRPIKNRWEKRWVRQWIQVTHIGLEAVTDASDLVAWTTTLADGSSLPDVRVSAGARTATTGADGIARLAATGGAIVARNKDDLTFMPDGVTASLYSPASTRFFTFDDRGMYKPGEDVHVKGWVRDVGYGKGGGVGLLPDSASRVVHWVAQDPRGAELSKGDANMDATGGFDFVATTPKTANLGRANVTLEIKGGGSDQRGSHAFQIQEFRRPEFEVTAKMSEGPVFVGDHATATAEAKYYAGGGLPGADVTWSVQRSEGSFVPPNRQDYVFGKREWTWEPSRDASKPAPPTSATWTGHTDSQGAHRLRLDFEPLDPAYPMSLALNASVMDVNRQAWAARTTLLVHPADVYVGLKLAKPFLKAGEAINVDALVVDLDGKPVAKRAVSVRSVRLVWEQTANGFQEKEVDGDECALTSTDAPLRCKLAAAKGGEYRLKAIVEDDHGRRSQTVTRVWVMGNDAPRRRNVSQDALEILADKKSYAAGDTAELLVVAPFTPAEGLVVVARQGILSIERFRMTTPMQTVTVKIDDAMTPNVHAFVFLAGAATRDDASGSPDEKLTQRPAYAHGEVDLSVPPTGRTLAVSVSPRDRALAPGGRTTIDIDVKNARGAAVAGAEVAVIVVDESILALSGYVLPDPLGTFFPSRVSNVNEGGTRALVTLAKPEEARSAGLGLGGFGEAGGGNGAGIGLAGIGQMAHAAAAPAASVAMRSMAKTAPTVPDMASTPIAVRSDFAALALFDPAKLTDAQGHLELPVKLPDSLTRYRVMAVAVAGEDEFGSHESTLTVRLPLMVRPSAPRFLSFGDKFELPVVLQNQTDAPMTVAVAVRAHNARITDAAGKRTVVPANDRVEVRFSAETVKPGTARFELAAAAGQVADAADVELPVWTPATTEAFATYGVIDHGAIAQPVKMPSGVFTQFGGLEITTSSTALQGLTDAVVYLVHYPFECNEQLASRILAIASLRDVLTAFDSKDLPPPAELQASMTADLEKLRTRQKPDGGWAFWWGEEWPFVSIHVAHAVARAEAKGYKIDVSMKERAKGYLRTVENHIPYWYDAESRRAIIAYSLYVRRLLGDADPARARRLIQESGGVEKMNIEAVGWIWPTLSEDHASQAENARVRRVVANRVTETAGAAHFVTSYGDGSYLLLHSDRRADAVLLEAMIVDQPTSDLIPKLVKGLLGHRTRGRWGSTQENAFVLLALDRYFEKYEAATPDFVARVWLGDGYVGDHTFKGRSTAYSETDVPMSFLADVKSGDLTLSKEGQGRMYYRIGMQYAPTDLRPPPMDQGFAVTRNYEPVESDGDVRKDADGVWHFKAGKQVRVRVTMVAPARRYHVALVDPLPAGVEPMNSALAVTGTIPHDPSTQAGANRYWYWSSTWYEHQNLRDERAEAFASLVWEGVHEYVYTVRATTPGTFVAGPPKAEEMYSPEVFGRGAGDRVVIE